MVYRCSNFFSSNTSWDENLNTSSKYVFLFLGQNTWLSLT